MSLSLSLRSPVALTALCIIWMAAIAIGTLVLAREEFTPVLTQAQKMAFPLGSNLPLAESGPTLILFVHPLCPCTRATMHELEELVEEAPGRVSVDMVFTIPDGLPSDWKQGDLWRSARALSGTRLIEDPRGVESRRFGVSGSGHCLLYAPSGALLFSGGITASRGHEGENPGRLALLDLITTGHANINRAPVFGCSLL